MIDYSSKQIADGSINHLGMWHKGLLAIESFKDKKVLDIGCGAGGFLKYLAGTAAERVGVDPNEKNVAMAQNSGADVYALYPEQLTGYDATIDIVTCFEVIEHLYTHHKIIDTCERVLAPGGVAYISTPNAFNILRIFDFVWNQEHRDTLMDPTRNDEPEHVRLWSYGMATRIVNRHKGMQVLRVYGITNFFGRVFVLRNKVLVSLFAQNLLIAIQKEDKRHGTRT